MIKILIVEDDKDLNRSVCSFLSQSGYEVTGCLNANDAYDAMYETMFDLIISDIMMPEIDGYEFAKTVRSLNAEIPILFMTAKDDILSMQRSYRIGIDDYMTKPVNLDELLLRIGALLRRAKIATSHRLEVGGFVMDLDEHTATLNDEEIILTIREFNILYKLLSYPKKTFSRQQLMDEFWDVGSTSGPRTVDVYMTKLRAKLADCKDFEIQTVHGIIKEVLFMNKTTYLLTGAAGFLGGNIARQLLDRGDSVRAFVLKNDPAIRFVPAECDVFEGDLTDKDSLRPFFEVPEGTETVCLHIASVVTVDPDYNPLVMNVNVGGTQNIIDLCLEHPECRKLVYCSSTGAIPELPKGKKIREVNYFDSSKVLGCYSESKAIATQLVLDAVHNRGLNACVVHPSGILGPNDPAVGETTKVLIQIINGEMPAGINGSFNLCDVRDLADGAIRAADQGKAGECYILGNEEVNFRDFAKMVSDEAGVKEIRTFLPVGFANFIAGILERQAKRSGKQPLMTTFSIYNLARNNDFDSTKAKNELGYHTRSYRDTIHDEIAWLRETGRIKGMPVATAV